MIPNDNNSPATGLLSHENRANTIAALIMSLFCAFYFGSIVYFTPNAPYLDDYYVVLKFLNMSGGQNPDRVAALLSQHNEHRMVFAKINALAARNFPGAVNFTALAVIGNFGLFLILLFFRQIAGIKNNYILLAPAALMLFSFLHWETIYFATGSLQNIWVMGFAAACAYFLAQENYPAAAVFAFIASFTSGNGMLMFLIGGGFLVYKRKFRELGLWAIPAALAAFMYFFRYSRPYWEPGASNPAQGAAYFLCFIGSAFVNLFKQAVPQNAAVIAAAVAGIAILSASIYLTIKGYYSKNPANYFIMLFVLGSGMLATIARSGYGPAQAFSSRYVFMSIIILVCLYIALLDLGIIRENKAGIYALTGALVIFNVYSFSIAGRLQLDRKNNVERGMYLLAKYGTDIMENNPHIFLTDRPGLDILNESKRQKDYEFNTKLGKYELEKFMSVPQMVAQPSAPAEKIGFVINDFYKIAKSNVLYIGGKSADKRKIYIVLANGHKVYFFNTLKDSRSYAAGKSGEKASGNEFYAFIELDGVQKGKYNVGIYIEEGTRGSLRATDKKLLIK
jgi:energy-converting hydrogenase Eha subunit C